MRKDLVGTPINGSVRGGLRVMAMMTVVGGGGGGVVGVAIIA